jgi:hypothetical protein
MLQNVSAPIDCNGASGTRPLACVIYLQEYKHRWCFLQLNNAQPATSRSLRVLFVAERTAFFMHWMNNEKRAPQQKNGPIG